MYSRDANVKNKLRCNSFREVYEAATTGAKKRETKGQFSIARAASIIGGAAKTHVLSVTLSATSTLCGWGV